MAFRFLENGRVPGAWRLIVGVPAALAFGVRPPGTLWKVKLVRGVRVVHRARAGCIWVRVECGMLAQMAVISRTLQVVIPRPGRVPEVKVGVVPGTGVGNFGARVRFEEEPGAGGGLPEGGGESREPLSVGGVLSERDQALQAIQVLKGIFGPGVEDQMQGLLQGHLPPKAESPAPASSTEEERIAQLNDLMGKRTKL